MKGKSLCAAVFTLVLVAAGCGTSSNPSANTTAASAASVASPRPEPSRVGATAPEPDSSLRPLATNGAETFPPQSVKNCAFHLIVTPDNASPGTHKLCNGPNQAGLESLDTYVRETTIPTFTGTPNTATMQGYLTTVLDDVLEYWTQAYAKAGIVYTSNHQPVKPGVKYLWLEKGQTSPTACGTEANSERSMFYCAADDTMYVGIDAILADWLGIPHPGETTHPATGEGSAIYTIAHEFSHNVQAELGINPDTPRHKLELQADCLAGVYLRGGINLDRDSNRQSFLDVISNAEFSGDWSFEDPDFHGTPDERMIAVLQGHDTADPTVCDKEYEPQ